MVAPECSARIQFCPQQATQFQSCFSFPLSFSSHHRQGVLMKRFLWAALAAGFIAGLGTSVRADEAEVKAVLDKAMKALGGEAKLAKGEAFSRKAKGRMS